MLRLRQKRAWFFATALSFSLAGCSSVPDALNPVDWYNDSADAVGGWFDGSDADNIEDTGSYPEVSSVPERPEEPNSGADRAEIRDQLVADRENAQYDESATLPVIGDAGTQGSVPLRNVSPSAPTTSEEVSAPSVAAPAAAPANEELKPVRMTARDEVTTQAEPSVPDTKTELPSRSIASASGSAPRSSLWPNSPPPDSEGDVPVTNARVGDPSRSPAPTVTSPDTVAPSRTTESSSATELPSLDTDTPTTTVPDRERPKAEPEPQRQIASAPATEPAEMPSEPQQATPGAVTLTPPAQSNPAGSFNFDDSSVTVDESALPGSLPSFSGAQGGSYQAGVIRFANGSARLSGADKGVIRELVPLIREYNAMVQVVGHSSSRTQNMDPSHHQLVNFDISLQRANAVAQALINAGAPSDRISVEAVADSQPLSSEAMPAGEADNRRAEIYLIY